MRAIGPRSSSPTLSPAQTSRFCGATQPPPKWEAGRKAMRRWVSISRSTGSDARLCAPLEPFFPDARAGVAGSDVSVRNVRSVLTRCPALPSACLSSTSRCRCNVQDVRPPRALRFASQQAITPTHAPPAQGHRSPRSPPVNGARGEHGRNKSYVKAFMPALPADDAGRRPPATRSQFRSGAVSGYEARFG